MRLARHNRLHCSSPFLPITTHSQVNVYPTKTVTTNEKYFYIYVSKFNVDPLGSVASDNNFKVTQ